MRCFTENIAGNTLTKSLNNKKNDLIIPLNHWPYTFCYPPVF